MRRYLKSLLFCGLSFCTTGFTQFPGTHNYMFFNNNDLVFFPIHGVTYDDESGRAVSYAGDVNGDGIDDVIIGAEKAEFGVRPAGGSEGEGYVVFGKATDTKVELSNLDTNTGNHGFIIRGYVGSAGCSVSAAGDVNGDGLDDIIIGAYVGGDPGVDLRGESYVVFGKTSTTEVNLAHIKSNTGGHGFLIRGSKSYDQSGFSVSGAGDVNGDGLDDIIIGAPFSDPTYLTVNGQNSAGLSYVVYGKTTTTAVNLAEIESESRTGNLGFGIYGYDIEDQSGYAVSGAGDVNGDGFDDVIIGAIGADPYGMSNAGTSYVVYGKASTPVFIRLRYLEVDAGNLGFAIYGASANDQSGYAVSAAGDVNGDGLDDVIVGAPWADPSTNSNAGSSYVVYGKTTSTPVRLSDVEGHSGSHGFAIHGASVDDGSGISVSGAGDVNGDCFDDVIIGAKYADPNGTSNKGSSYVVFGKSTASASTVGLSNIESNSGYHGFAIYGSQYLDYSGSAVSKAGDMNKDGLGDVIVGSPMADPRTTNSGRKNAAGISYVIFGKATTTPVQLTD